MADVSGDVNDYQFKAALDRVKSRFYENKRQPRKIRQCRVVDCDGVRCKKNTDAKCGICRTCLSKKTLLMEI